MNFLLLLTVVISCLAYSKSLDEKIYTSAGQKFKIEPLIDQKKNYLGF